MTILPPPLPEETEGEEALREYLPQTRKDIGNVSADIEAYFQNYSPQTVKAYKSDLDTYWSFINKPIQNTREQDVLRYIKILEDKGYSNSTINRRIASLSKIIAIYNTMGLMNYNPVQSLGRVGKLYKPQDKAARTNKITRHDVEAVIANSSSARTAAMVRFLANTGVRISEMIHIRKEDLEPFDSDFMRIKITKAKGGKIRFVFLRYDIYQQVKAAFDSDSEMLFASRSGLRLNRSNIYNTINKAFRKHAYKSASPHDLRHFFATQLIVEKKKDYKAVSKALGHSTPAITLAVYTHSELSPEDSVII